jgi:hypothetical protein
MTADQILIEAGRLGIRLSAREGGRLGFDAPAGAMTDEMKAALVANRSEILARLKAPPATPGFLVERWRPRSLPWRSTVGSWPIHLRQRWGDRANALHDEGHAWHEAERIAFEEVSASLRPG